MSHRETSVKFGAWLPWLWSNYCEIIAGDMKWACTTFNNRNAIETTTDGNERTDEEKTDFS